MNDLDILRAMRSEMPPPSQEVLAHARSRLLDQKAARSRWFPPRLRAGWQTVAAATIVVVLGVGAIVSIYERAGGPADRPHPSPSETVQSVLARAAQTAAQQAAGPRATADQYWYAKYVIRDLRPNAGQDEDATTAEYWWQEGWRLREFRRVRFEHETGDSLDFTTRNGQSVVIQNGQVVDARTWDRPQWYKDLPNPSTQRFPGGVAATAPTNATDLLDFIRDEFPSAVDRFWGLAALLTQQVLTPQQRAAACEALGRLPDLSLVPDAVDIAGRHGVGIVFDSDFARFSLILDGGCEVLGFELIRRTGPTVEFPDMAEAILAGGVVDSVDERP